jgi:hypothetical protein
MATLNGNAATLSNQVGIFGAGATAGTSNSAGGYSSVMPDVFQFEYTATSATPCVFTAANAVTAEGAFANTSATTGVSTGDIVTLGYAGPLFSYTMTSASPAVFTSFDLENAGGAEGFPGTLIQNGMPVVLYGIVGGGFTASTTQQPYNSPAFTQTIYYMVSVSGNTFELSATLGGSAINSTSAISSLADTSMGQIIGGTSSVPTGFSAFVPYYVVAQSGNTFELALTPGGSAIASTSTGSGIFMLDSENTIAPQVPAGNASAGYQMYSQGGFRIGLQPGQAQASATTLSLDENPQLAWQNVVGATCQTSYTTGVGGSSAGAGGVQVQGVAYNGWGAKGGVSANAGSAGQTVYEVVLHTNETNGESETTAERKARLGKELDALKAKASPTQKEKDRKAVVEKALSELK